MALKPYNTKNIINNIERVLKTENSEALNKTGYNFLYLMSGFIAHYDLYGFQDYYKDLRQLIADILNSGDIDRPEYYLEEFFINSYGREYCESKTETLRQLKTLALKYKDKIEARFSDKQKDNELYYARLLAGKYGYKLAVK